MNIILFLLYVIVFILILNFVLSKMKINVLETRNISNINEYNFIDNYYYSNYININNSLKKKIFVHIPDEINQRNWITFNDRNSRNLNIDLCKLCIKSLLYHCSKNYDIILYTNNDVKNIEIF